VAWRLHSTKRELHGSAEHVAARRSAQSALPRRAPCPIGPDNPNVRSQTMNLTPLATAPLAVQIHAVAAIGALVLGALVLFRRKGTPLHRLMGRLWVVLMLVVATSALFINEIRLIGPFSPIHLFVVVTYGGLAVAIWRIRRGDVVGHRAAMVTLYFGALLLTGAFTLLPGRRMHDVLFGAEAGWTPALVAIPLCPVAAGLLWRRLMPKRRLRPA